MSVTGLVLGTRQLGQLESLELAVYDAMVRVRPEPSVDSRLLIVAITEADIAFMPQRLANFNSINHEPLGWISYAIFPLSQDMMP